MAEAITSTDNLKDGFYVLRNVYKRTFLHEYENSNTETVDKVNPNAGALWLGNVSDEDTYGTFRSAFEGSDKNLMDYVVYIESNGDNTYTMQFQSGKYMPSSIPTGWIDAATREFTYPSDEAGRVEIGHISNASFWFKPTESTYYAEGWGYRHVSGKFVGSGTTQPDGSNTSQCYEFYPVTLNTLPPFTEGSYYRIRNVGVADGGNAYISTEGKRVNASGILTTDYDSQGNRIVARSVGKDIVPQLWHMTRQDDGMYMVVNANTTCPLGACTADNTDLEMPTNGAFDYGGHMLFKTTTTAFTSAPEGVTNDGRTMFLMTNSGRNIAAYGDNTLQSNADEADAKCYWTFEQVTSVPVSIGTTGWASIALPFEVTIPEDSNVKAYYAGTPADGQLPLTAIENGVIPAGEGVFLLSDGATRVDLAVTSTGATLPEANTLKGATAERNGFTSASTYLLALDKNGTAALVKSELTRVPANKAYLEASAFTADLSVLSFRFGGVNAGIADAKANPASETYYDLSGRPVLYPHNGVFVTGTGRKVYMK